MKNLNTLLKAMDSEIFALLLLEGRSERSVKRILFPKDKLPYNWDPWCNCNPTKENFQEYIVQYCRKYKIKTYYRHSKKQREDFAKANPNYPKPKTKSPVYVPDYVFYRAGIYTLPPKEETTIKYFKNQLKKVQNDNL